MSRHAPPRSRTDPFSDFTVDHGTILSSLAQERDDAKDRQATAKNAGALLRKMEMEQGGGGDISVGRASSRGGSEHQHQQQQQPQSVSNLQRLREQMSALKHHHNNDDDGDNATMMSQQQQQDYSTNRNSPSRGDFNNYLSTTQGISPAPSPSTRNPNQQQQQQHFSTASSNSSAGHQQHITRGGGGLSNNTAQHILKDMQGLRDSISRLEQHLMSDMKRRVESHAALQRTVELRVREIAENAERKAQDRMVKLHHTLDAATQRVSKLEGALAVEREKNARLVQELKYHSVRGLQEIRQQLETERNARSERVAAASRNFEQEMFRVEEHVAVAKRAREGLSEEVRDAIVRAQEARAESEDKLLQSMMSDIKSFGGKLESETKERETGEEQLAGAMADLAQHLSSLSE